MQVPEITINTIFLLTNYIFIYAIFRYIEKHLFNEAGQKSAANLPASKNKKLITKGS
jgi:hypothetical protein